MSKSLHLFKYLKSVQFLIILGLYVSRKSGTFLYYIEMFVIDALSFFHFQS